VFAVQRVIFPRKNSHVAAGKNGEGTPLKRRYPELGVPSFLEAKLRFSGE